MVQVEHATVMLGVEMNLPRVLVLTVRYCKAISDFNLRLTARTNQRTNDTRLCRVAAQKMVEDGKKRHLCQHVQAYADVPGAL